MNKQNFAMKMRESNKNLHTAAETTGFNARLVAGKATKESYAEYLFNLKHAYSAIERNLDENSDIEALKPFVTKDLYRSAEIEKDLNILLGKKMKEMELLPSTLAYVARINEIGKTNPILLVAHAYARFLADLFGGRTIFEIVKTSYNIEPEALNYFMFPEIESPKMRAMMYIKNLSEMKLSDETEKLFLNETANSYVYNIGVSVELEAKLFQEYPYDKKPQGHPHGNGMKMPAGHPPIKEGMKMPEGHPHMR